MNYSSECRAPSVATRAFSVLEIKSFDEETREFAGIATTPSTDLMDDIVESKGGQFQLPIPLLWQHDKERPVGHITHVQVSDDGIAVRGKLVRPFEGAPPSWAERLNVAWADMKTRLVRGLSIGFKPLEWEPIKGTMGYRYTKWSWLELSPVTIAANMDASITAIKSIAALQERAASGRNAPRSVVRLDSPAGVTAKRKSITPEEGKSMNVSEQIKAFEAKRMATASSLDALLEKAADEGRTLDENEQKEHDELDADVERIDQHLKNLHAAEARQMSRARPVGAQSATDSGAASRSRDPYITVVETLPKGVEFARYVKCLVASRGIPVAALEVAKQQYPDNPRIATILKAAVAAGTTTDAQWAGSLVEYTTLANEFIEFLRPQTILGKFGTGNIPALNSVPFNVRIPRQLSGGEGYWVGQGKAKPLTSFTFDAVTFDFYKVANIAVLTDELVRFSNPKADILTRNALAKALVARLDIDFIDPAKTLDAGVSPASITNGIGGITASGSGGVDGIFADIEAAMAAFAANNLAPNVAIMSSMNALALSLLRYPLSGTPVFAGMSAQGGIFAGLPVIVSEYVSQVGATGSSPIVFMNTNEILLADDGTVTIDASNQVSLEMADNPAHNSTTPTGASLVSMWQTNSVALKAERYINWLRARDEAVVWIDGAAYTSVAST